MFFQTAKAGPLSGANTRVYLGEECELTSLLVEAAEDWAGIHGRMMVLEFRSLNINVNENGTFGGGRRDLVLYESSIKVYWEKVKTWFKNLLNRIWTFIKNVAGWVADFFRGAEAIYKKYSKAPKPTAKQLEGLSVKARKVLGSNGFDLGKAVEAVSKVADPASHASFTPASEDDVTRESIVKRVFNKSEVNEAYSELLDVDSYDVNPGVVAAALASLNGVSKMKQAISKQQKDSKKAADEGIKAAEKAAKATEDAEARKTAGLKVTYLKTLALLTAQSIGVQSTVIKSGASSCKKVVTAGYRRAGKNIKESEEIEVGDATDVEAEEIDVAVEDAEITQDPNIDVDPTDESEAVAESTRLFDNIKLGF